MKIRTGFVSNSSSSSFCIYGTCVDDEDDLGGKLSNLSWGKDKIPGLSVWAPCNSGVVFLGLNFTSIQDDETGREFKDRAEKMIHRVMEKVGYKEPVTLSVCEDSWYDG